MDYTIEKNWNGYRIGYDESKAEFYAIKDKNKESKIVGKNLSIVKNIIMNGHFACYQCYACTKISREPCTIIYNLDDSNPKLMKCPYGIIDSIFRERDIHKVLEEFNDKVKSNDAL